MPITLDDFYFGRWKSGGTFKVFPSNTYNHCRRIRIYYDDIIFIITVTYTMPICRELSAKTY